MPKVLAFDVYGTLIDTHGVVTLLDDLIGERAKDFSQRWRDKQLEYSFRRGLMQNYENFAVCTQQALDYTCAYYQVTLSNNDKKSLLTRYRALPAFSDVVESLLQLKANGHQLYAFSNGSTDAVNQLLVSAGIRDLFIKIVSTDDMQSFKPNPGVYGHFLRESNAQSNEAWLISSNPFDVIGAISAGMRAAWVKRTQEALFDPWGIEPTMTIESLLELNDKLS